MHTFCHWNRILLRPYRNELLTLQANALATSDSRLAAFGSVTLICLHGKSATLIWVSTNNTLIKLLSKLVISTTFLTLVTIEPVSREIYLSGQWKHCKETVKHIIMRSERVERERRTSNPTRHPQMIKFNNSWVQCLRCEGDHLEARNQEVKVITALKLPCIWQQLAEGKGWLPLRQRQASIQFSSMGKHFTDFTCPSYWLATSWQFLVTNVQLGVLLVTAMVMMIKVDKSSQMFVMDQQ